MAKGAAPLERGGVLHAISEDHRVLYMADMKLDHDPNVGFEASFDLEGLRGARCVCERRGYPTDLLDTYIQAVEDGMVAADREDNVRRHERVVEAMGQPGAREG